VIVSELVQEIRAAEKRLDGLVHTTPLEHSHWLSTSKMAVYLKLENFQATGSFKARGAANAVQRAVADDEVGQVTTASTGNHGAAVAYASARAGVKCLVAVPADASEAKTSRIESLGAELLRIDGDPLEVELAARALAEEGQSVYISPYNDASVIAGQGTVGLEIVRQIPHQPDAIYASVGGGGLISGVAAAIKAEWPETDIVGCSPELSPVMARSVEAGRVATLPFFDTLSDGTAGGMEEGSITLPLCTQLVDRWVEVSEADIARTLYGYIEHEHQLIEGSAAVAVRAAIEDAADARYSNVAVVVCGGNISLSNLKAVLNIRA